MKVGRRRLSTVAAALLGLAVALGVSFEGARAAHTTFDGNPFTSGTDVVTGFTGSQVCTLTSGSLGPTGLLNDGTSFFVDDFCNETTYKFPPSGGAVGSALVTNNNGLGGGIALVGGIYYGIVQNGQYPIAGPAAGLWTFDPTTLNLIRHVTSISGDTSASGTFDRNVIGDPTGTTLYVSSSIGIYKVNPTTGATTLFATGNFDGMVFSNDGSILYGADPINNVVREFNAATGAQIVSISFASQGPDGLVVAPPGSAPNGQSIAGDVFVNTNDGHIQRIDTSNAVVEAARGGSRGDLATTDPQGCVYVTQSNTVEKLNPCLGTAPSGIPEAPRGPALLVLAGVVALGGSWYVRRRRRAA